MLWQSAFRTASTTRQWCPLAGISKGGRRFQVSYIDLDGALATEISGQLRCPPAQCAADRDAGRLDGKAAGDDGEIGALLGQDR